MKFIITVDTEADNQWKKEAKVSLENIKFLPRFQSLCDKYEFPVSYLVAHEIAESEESVNILKEWQDKGTAEIGAHLHPWTNPPYTRDILDERKIHRFPHELSESELDNKLKDLTDIITIKFGQKPRSFRAGRWGFDEKVASALVKHGYQVDCSVTPKLSWKVVRGDPELNGGQDFTFAPISPYYLSNENILKPAEKGMLEIPVTVLFTGCFNFEGTLLGRIYLGLKNNFFKKVLRKLVFKEKWLRIYRETQVQDFINIYKSAKRNNLDVLEFMIHSSELMAGGSPYARNEAEVDRIYMFLEEFFKYLKEYDVEGITLTGYKNYFDNIAE